MLLSSFAPSNQTAFCRFDEVADIDKLVETWPMEADRDVLAVYMAVGMRDALRELFVS